jgi:hypothetical protein
MSVLNTGKKAESAKQSYDAEFGAADTDSRESPDGIKGDNCAHSCYGSTSC